MAANLCRAFFRRSLAVCSHFARFQVVCDFKLYIYDCQLDKVSILNLRTSAKTIVDQSVNRKLWQNLVF